jgi:hypothetical protein
LIALYALALVGVSVVLLGVLLEAVVSVSRKPAWGFTRQHLTVVPEIERRVLRLSYVGQERRDIAAAAEQAQRKRA